MPGWIIYRNSVYSHQEYRVLQRAHQSAPERADILLALGYALARQGQPSAAQAMLEQSLNLYHQQGSTREGIVRRALEQLESTGKLTHTTLASDSPRQRSWLDPTSPDTDS
jgi:uncharacterized protein HemY